MATGVAKSHYWENKILNAIKGTNIIAPATTYLALFTVMPADDGTGGTEVTTSGTAYARQAITWGTITVQAEGETLPSGADATFAVATANYGTVVGFGIYDAVTVGNLLYYGTLSANQVINTGGQFIMASGNLTVEEH